MIHADVVLASAVTIDGYTLPFIAFGLPAGYDIALCTAAMRRLCLWINGKDPLIIVYITAGY